MLGQRQRAVVWAVATLAAIWVVALTGYWIAANSRMTADKVRAYLESVDLSQLSAADRARALKELEQKVNALSFEERQKLRLGRTFEDWFSQMTEDEKAGFLEATLPTGFKQMLTAFEAMPEDRRRRAVDDAVKRLREARDQANAGQPPGRGGTNQPPISPELEAKIRTIGLKSFYSESSAETKAELAPLLEELQQTMQSRRFQRRRR